MKIRNADSPNPFRKAIERSLEFQSDSLGANRFIESICATIGESLRLSIARHSPRLGCVVPWRSLVIVGFGCWFQSIYLKADPLDHWQWRNPLPTAEDLKAVAYGNGQFVAVGSSGTILTSADAVSWKQERRVVFDDLSDIASGSNIFVAVGGSGTLLSSTDGVNWAPNSSGTDGWLVGVSYGRNKYVVIGSEYDASLARTIDLILTSVDGTNWTPHRPTTYYGLTDIAYGNGTFVAVSWSRTILTSTDGTNWVERSSGNDNGSYGITYGNGIFVAVGYAGSILTSGDGMNWVQRSSGIGDSLQSITYGNGTFVAVFMSLGECATLTSADGVSWTKNNFRVSPCFQGITHGNGIFVGVGFEGEISTSIDGLSWTRRSAEPFGSLHGIIHGDDSFVTVGDGGTILRSADGVNWIQAPSGSESPLHGITYGNGTFVAVGDNGTILNSADAIRWVPAPSGIRNGIVGVAYGNGVFAAVASAYYDFSSGQWTNGKIMSSTDGMTWTERDRVSEENYTGDVYGIAYGNGTFVVASSDGAIMTSSNGVNWMRRSSSISSWFRAVTYGEGTFVAVGGDRGSQFSAGTGVVFSSVDGLNWTEIYREVGNPFTAVSHGNGFFVAASLASVLTSEAGGCWAYASSGTSRPLEGISFGNDTFVGVGWAGTIIQSGVILSNAPMLKLSSCTYSVNEAGGSLVLTVQRTREMSSAVTVDYSTSDGTAMAGKDYAAASGTLRFAAGETQKSFSVVIFNDDLPEDRETINVILSNPTGGGALGVPSSATITILDDDSDYLNHWQSRNQLPAGSYLYAISYGNATYVAVGTTVESGGFIVTSTDATTWTLQTPPEPIQSLRDIAYGNGIFVAVGSSGTVLTSGDGTGWTSSSSGIIGEFTDVDYRNGAFTILG